MRDKNMFQKLFIQRKSLDFYILFCCWKIKLASNYFYVFCSVSYPTCDRMDPIKSLFISCIKNYTRQRRHYLRCSFFFLLAFYDLVRYFDKVELRFWFMWIWLVSRKIECLSSFFVKAGVGIFSTWTFNYNE